jgi:hypothetical protein
MKKMSEKIQIGVVLLILLGVFIATSWSVFVPGMFRVHDYVHGARIAEIVRGVEAGHFPVRWSDHFGFGYGMPLYVFYAPLPYYFGGFVYWLSDNLIWGVKSLFLLANLGSIIGGFFFGSRIANNKRGGIIGAVAFGLAPYRALNLFVRGAVSEAWAMMFLVWLWYGMLGLMGFSKSQQKGAQKENKNWHADWWIVLASSVGIMLSHNLTTLMAFSSLAVGILFWIVLSFPYTAVWLQPRSWKKLISDTVDELIAPVFRISSALLLAGGAASFYLLPMFIEKKFIQTDIFLTGYFDFRLHFLYIRQFFDSTWAYGGSAWGPEDDISFFLGWPFFVSLLCAALIVILLSIALVFTNQKKLGLIQTLFKKIKELINPTKPMQILLQIVDIKVLALFSFLTAGTLFLTIQKSSFLWEYVPLIENIQFPWRWLSVATVGVTALTVLAVSTIDRIQSIIVLRKLNIPKFNSVLTSGLLFICTGIVIIVGFLQTPFFTPELWLDTPDALYYEDPVRIQTRMSEIMLDYVPKTVNIADMTKDIANGLPISDSLETLVTEFETTDTQFVGEYETLVNDPHQKLVQISTKEATQVVFSTADFPGWNMYVNAQTVPKETTDTGLLAITVTPGDHEVGIRFESTPIRLFADALTFISSIVLVSIAAAHMHTKYAQA